MRSLYYNVAVSVLGFSVLFSTLAPAQVNGFQGHLTRRGVPASVTSIGFGGHPGFHGVPASVTSLDFGAPRVFGGTVLGSTSFDFDGFRGGTHGRPFGFRHHHHHFFGLFSPFYGGYVPYAYPYYLSGDDYADDDASSYESRRTRDAREYDDRETLKEDYRAELNSAREPQPKATPEPVANQPNTVLIFKDGHQREIENYAIVGSTLYDLSDGRSKKIQLSELDLPATVKQNDDRGVEFQLPAQ